MDWINFLRLPFLYLQSKSLHLLLWHIIPSLSLGTRAGKGLCQWSWKAPASMGRWTTTRHKCGLLDIYLKYVYYAFLLVNGLSVQCVAPNSGLQKQFLELIMEQETFQMSLTKYWGCLCQFCLVGRLGQYWKRYILLKAVPQSFNIWNREYLCKRGQWRVKLEAPS